MSAEELLDLVDRSSEPDKDRWSITLSTVVPTSRENLWTYLTDAKLFGTWSGGPVDGDPASGDDYRIDTGDGFGVRGKATVIDQPQHLTTEWDWNDAKGMHFAFRLEPESEGTRLTLTQSSLPKRQYAVGFGAGWDCCLLDLRSQFVAIPDEAADGYEKSAAARWNGIVAS